jgi:hypothetical protein
MSTNWHNDPHMYIAVPQTGVCECGRVEHHTFHGGLNKVPGKVPHQYLSDISSPGCMCGEGINAMVHSGGSNRCWCCIDDGQRNRSFSFGACTLCEHDITNHEMPVAPAEPISGTERAMPVAFTGVETRSTVAFIEALTGVTLNERQRDVLAWFYKGQS